MASLPVTGSPAPASSPDVLPDAWDFRGRPALRSETGGWSRASMILVVEVCERMTTLGIAVNLVTYLKGTMHMGSAAAANAVTNFLGTSFMLCLLGGFLADSLLGRYLTIAIFAAIQCTGVTVLAISTAATGLRPPECSPSPESECVPATGGQLGVLYLALYMTALGTGGLKSSVSGFGTDQFDTTEPKEREGMRKLFTWLFFIINLGSLVAVTALVYVQDNVGRKWGYGIDAAMVAAGLAVFLSGTKGYRFKRLAGSPMTQIAAVAVAAFRKRRLRLPEDASKLYDAVEKATPVAEKELVAVAQDDGYAKQRLPHSKKLRFLDKAAIVVGGATKEEKQSGRWRLSTVTDVEEVKTLIGMLPIWATTIMFWTVYAQMTTFSVTQATTMDRRIAIGAIGGFDIPAGSLTVFFVGSILLTVAFYDRAVFPAARRLTSNPQGLTPLQRITVGLLLSILAMASAAIAELKRLRAFRSGEKKLMSVFLLVPQFLLVGAGEAFTYMGQLDFYLSECPKGMKTMSTGLFLSTLSMGFFLSSALVAMVQRATGGDGRSSAPWLPDDINDGKLYDFYWLLAALSAVNFGAFVVCARGYVYKENRAAAAAAEEDELN